MQIVTNVSANINQENVPVEKLGFKTNISGPGTWGGVRIIMSPVVFSISLYHMTTCLAFWQSLHYLGKHVTNMYDNIKYDEQFKITISYKIVWMGPDNKSYSKLALTKGLNKVRDQCQDQKAHFLVPKIFSTLSTPAEVVPCRTIYYIFNS